MDKQISSIPPVRALIVAATLREAQALARGCGSRFAEGPPWTAQPVLPWADLAESGVGKAAAAGAVAHCATSAHGMVLCVGIAGAMLEEAFVPGELILGTQSVMADEGVQTPTGFVSISQLGFATPGNEGHGISPSEGLARDIRGLVDRTGIVATVSTCSGTDARAREVRDRTGAVCEAMEGAGAGMAAVRLGLDFAEVRSISNLTGNRERQRWDIDAGMAGLERLGAGLARFRERT